MATRVIIVRHGQSTYNAQKRIQGRCDESVLTDLGQAQAHKVAAALRDVAIDAVYHSPLQRATQTAQLIAQELGTIPTPNPDEHLREIDLPLWEKLTKQEVVEQFPAAYHQWKTEPYEFCMDVNGQAHYPVRSLYAQAQTFWQNLLPQHTDQTVLIVAHNGINRCLLMSAIGMHPSRYQSIQQSNCCISILNFTGGWGDAVQLESLNQLAHMGLAVPEPRPPHNQLRLLLVRHGETDWNKASRFQGIKDIPLNEHGRFQASKAAEYLVDVPFNAAVTSPLSRSKETAEIILQHHAGVTLDVEPDLKEIGHGLWEGKLSTEIQTEYGELLAQWLAQPETVQMPEGENLKDVWDRAVVAWEAIVKRLTPGEPKTVLVAAHDAVNKVIICALLGLEPKNFWNIKQGNGAVTVVDYPQGAGDQPVLQAMNLTTFQGSGILDQTTAGAL
ncbi:MAG: histidine phosphatase family protein [Spirulina sp. SIO3F2]|nr:histidine phosphatase family protein [Spirulina sp. SIO3F2]